MYHWNHGIIYKCKNYSTNDCLTSDCDFVESTTGTKMSLYVFVLVTLGLHAVTSITVPLVATTKPRVLIKPLVTPTPRLTTTPAGSCEYKGKMYMDGKIFIISATMLLLNSNMYFLLFMCFELWRNNILICKQAQYVVFEYWK